MHLDFLSQVSGGSAGTSHVHVLVLQILRWTHFFFGIAWIGHLYYFNFVQGAAEKALDGPMKKIVVPNFRGRAMWWFRWGAMLTFLTGLTYIVYQEFIASDRHFSGWLSFDAGGAGPSNAWILFGGLLGTIMWFNVWFVIWPRQKLILGGMAAGTPHPDAAKLAAAAGKASRFNTYVSGPMLFAMIVPNNYSGWTHAGIGLTFILGLGFWFGLIKRSFKVKTTV